MTAFIARPCARWHLRTVAFLGFSLVITGREARAQPTPPPGQDAGAVDLPVSCTAAARAEFARGVSLLHHMTYPQAREAFERAAALDPRCAMAHWGTAMTLFQPLWPTRPGPDALQRGWDEVQRAKALGAPTERERRFIATAEAFFLEPASTDYWLRIRRWESALASAHAARPQDDEMATFYALAHLASAPADSLSRTHADRAAAILVDVLRRHPEHPGAMHYLVHANDAPGREHEELDNTRTYERVAPGNPHALHMPTHIYTRLGDWDGVVRGNALAAEAALRHPAGAGGDLVWDEFPHAIEYLVYAHLQRGADDEAAAEVRRLWMTPRLEPTFKSAFHLASTRARHALEREDWAEAAGIVPREPATLPWDRFPWPEAIAQFARGLGAAHLGDRARAVAARARLDSLETAAATAGELLFARNIRLLRLELDAWISHVDGREAESRSLLADAVALEGSTPKHAVTPGPTIPASELLGDLLMEQGRPAEALAAYRQSLALYPRRYRSTLGLARAARASGRLEVARSAYADLLALASAGSSRASLTEARAFLAPSGLVRDPGRQE